MKILVVGGTGPIGGYAALLGHRRNDIKRVIADIVAQYRT